MKLVTFNSFLFYTAIGNDLFINNYKVTLIFLTFWKIF